MRYSYSAAREVGPSTYQVIVEDDVRRETYCAVFGWTEAQALSRAKRLTSLMNSSRVFLQYADSLT